jgi:hypothetical protein
MTLFTIFEFHEFRRPEGRTFVVGAFGLRHEAASQFESKERPVKAVQ